MTQRCTRKACGANNLTNIQDPEAFGMVEK